MKPSVILPLLAVCVLVIPAGNAAAPTFNRELAPVVFKHCASCHRPNGSGPFSLLTFADVRKHIREIVEVTAKRQMPPWPPSAGCGEFVGERKLSDAEIQLFKLWSATGLAEGDPSHLPALPQWSDDWQLGQPDLVVEMPEPFIVPAEGRDVFRSLVLPLAVKDRKFVRAFEFRPGGRSVHHALFLLDATSQSRARDAQDPGPGFGGMDTPNSARAPDGHFVTWLPGRGPYISPDGLPWEIKPGEDLVAKLHFQTSGKPEAVRASLGFYFTNQPPRNAMFKFALTTLAIDIPAGAAHFKVSDSYVLPLPARLNGLLPHAHYLGKSVRVWATLPQGAEQCLLDIQQWDFNWQSDYRFARPAVYPKGTRINMEIAFDNSSANPRNPSNPPRRVGYGFQSSDEMAEVWVQVLPEGGPEGNRREVETLRKDFEPKLYSTVRAYHEYRLRLNPKDGSSHMRLAMLDLATNNVVAAEARFRQAILADPALDEPRYHLGMLLVLQNRRGEALVHLQEAARLNSANTRAHIALATLFAEDRKLPEAEQHFRAALRAQPDEPAALRGLKWIEQSRKANPSAK